MRPAFVTTFHGTVSYCFNSELEMMGTSIHDVIYERLERRGIPASDISTRLDDVVAVLYESLWGKRSSDRVQDGGRVLSAGTTAPAAGDSVTGATNCDCGKPTDSELTANDMARAAGTVTDGLTGSNNPRRLRRPCISSPTLLLHKQSLRVAWSTSALRVAQTAYSLLLQLSRTSLSKCATRFKLLGAYRRPGVNV